VRWVRVLDMQVTLYDKRIVMQVTLHYEFKQKFPREKVGFKSSRIYFLYFFNDPKIIMEQRIAAYKGYRGGGVGCLGVLARNKQQGGYVANFVTKKCIEVRWVRVLDMQVMLYDKRIVMQVMLHYEFKQKFPREKVATSKDKNINGEEQIHAKVDGKKVIISEATIRRDLKFEDEGGVDCLSSSLNNLHSWDGMSKHNAIYVIPSHTKKVFGNIKWVGNDFSRKKTPLFSTMLVQAQADIDSTMPSAPQHTPIIQPSTSKPQKKQKPKKSKNKDTKETQPSDPTDEALNEENVPVQSNDPPLLRVNTLRSREDRLKFNELMELYTKLSNKVHNLETTKTAQAKKTFSLKRRVKRLEKKKRSGTHGLKRLYKVGLSARVESYAKEQSLGKEDASKQGRNIADIDANDEITLVDETAKDQGRFDDQEMFDTRVLDDEKVVVKKTVTIKEVDAAQDQVSAATTTVAKELTIDDITLAKALEALKTSKPKIRRIVVIDHKEPSESTTIPTSIADSTRPKEKCIVMEEPKEPLKMKKKYQISFDEQEARRLQAELDQEQRLEQRLVEEEAQKALEANIAMIEQWHDPRALKNKSFVEIKELFDKAMTRINNFVDFRTELVKESSKKAEEISSKRAGDELKQGSAKKQKVDDDQEAAELKRCLEIVPDDEDGVTIDATPLSFKEGLKVLWSIVKTRFEKMWNDVRLQVDYEVEMTYDLLRLVRRQLGEGYVLE
nr:hypothetical protein [Tanacetum cinerariifolium]